MRVYELFENAQEEQEAYYSNELVLFVQKLLQSKYPGVGFSADVNEEEYLEILSDDGEFGFYISPSYQERANIISVANAYAGKYRGLVGPIVQQSVRMLQAKHPKAEETVLVTQDDKSDGYWGKLAAKLGIEIENNAW